MGYRNNGLLKNHPRLLLPALLYHCPEEDPRLTATAKAGCHILSGGGNEAFCGGEGFQLRKPIVPSLSKRISQKEDRTQISSLVSKLS